MERDEREFQSSAGEPVWNNAGEVPPRVQGACVVCIVSICVAVWARQALHTWKLHHKLIFTIPEASGQAFTSLYYYILQDN